MPKRTFLPPPASNRRTYTCQPANTNPSTKEQPLHPHLPPQQRHRLPPVPPVSASHNLLQFSKFQNPFHLFCSSSFFTPTPASAGSGNRVQDSVIKMCVLPFDAVDFWFLLTHSSELDLPGSYLFIGCAVLRGTGRWRRISFFVLVDSNCTV